MGIFQLLFYNLSTMFGCVMLAVLASWNKKVKVRLDVKGLVNFYSLLGLIYMFLFLLIGSLVKALLS